MAPTMLTQLFSIKYSIIVVYKIVGCFTASHKVNQNISKPISYLAHHVSSRLRK